ncbi:hypothetical protein F5Y17DRAFT_446624 [Xylariaceae sp. FL0594]|nr:hypothetical protein F5Y17DRAFT_446624 [Xylariaceae sp. FL0594]
MTMQLEGLPEIGGTSFNQKTAVLWLEKQAQDQQLLLADHVFKELLATASQPKQFSGSACSKLCGFVDLCSKSASPALKGFAFTRETSVKLFNYFIEWNEQDSHRSMRLVLDYLVSAIKWNPDAGTAKSIKDTILNDTISVITLQASRPSTKSSMIALDHLIQKKVAYLGEVIAHYKQIRGHSLDGEDPWDSFIIRVFAWMESQNVWTVAGKLLVTVLTRPWYEDDEPSRHQPETWHRFVLSGFENNPELLEPIKVYIFIPLFKSDPIAALRYLDELTSLQKLTINDSRKWDLNAMLWVALLEAGKKTGVVGEPDDVPSQGVAGTGHLPVDILDLLLCHRSHEARASGLSILVASPSTTKPYAMGTLDLLKKHLPSYHEDVDPKIRYDVLGHSRNIIRRMFNSIDTLQKESARASKASASWDKKLVGHQQFLQWYAAFLTGELLPTASYQRHITSLRAMYYFLKSGLANGDGSSLARPPVSYLVNGTWFRSVLDLIMDPYDDVRETAASLIALILPGKSMSGPPASIQGLHSSPFEELQMFCEKANDLALKTARADHCDGAARAQELLCRWSSNAEEATKVMETVLNNLEQKLYAAEKDLATAVLQAPVHGDFASLGYIWGSISGTELDAVRLAALDEFQNRAILGCRRIWGAVRHILCDDSPEGHLPEELQQVEGLDTKDLLSYSFRAIHESSNLMRIIAQNVRYDRASALFAPTWQNFEDIGNLTFDQLSNLRHRGAFSTVSQTFTGCCQLVQCVPGHQDQAINLLIQWYHGALDCIHTQRSTTRRSAGIPAIIVGILASKASSPSFEDVIRKLQEIGGQPAFVTETDGSNLAQVHALNCLKDVFKTSFLSHRAEPYLTDCLQLAARSLQSEVWAIRNCGLLLLRSLIDNLFGTTENKVAMEAGWDGRSVRIAYHKFEALPSLLVNLLELGKNSSGITIGSQTAEAVFPALDIIRRAGPPEGYRTKLHEIISWYLGSHIWHVREIAARTLCSLLLIPTWLSSVKSLVLSASGNSNKLHGALLTVRFLLERLCQVMPSQLSEANINQLCTILSDLSSSSDCLYTCTEAQAVYIDLCNFVDDMAEDKGQWELVDLRETPYQDASHAPFALLNIRRGEAVVQRALKNIGDGDEALTAGLIAALGADVNVACAMLEAISNRDLPRTEAARSRLANAYVQVCFATDAPEPRTIALEALASLLDVLLASSPEDNDLRAIPPAETLMALWSNLYQKPLNTSLLDAIIRVSGPLVAVTLVRARGSTDDVLATRLRNWGDMMSKAGLADQTFDTRMAVVEAMRSVSSSAALGAGKPENGAARIHTAHLPWLFALYDALADDDVEVREAASEAVVPILGQALVPVEAGARLSGWLAKQFGPDAGFQIHVAGRMVGHEFGSSSHPTRQELASSLSELGWVPAEAQLEEAMRFDDSLFVVEEHNQYIDEVLEARRWTDLFLSIVKEEPTGGIADVATFIAEWTFEGLRTMTGMTQSNSLAACDGPLGWTSKPQVFAICARILMCASAIVRCNHLQDRGSTEGHGGGRLYLEVEDALKGFWELGRTDQQKLHGTLLNMCEVGEECT